MEEGIGGKSRWTAYVKRAYRLEMMDTLFKFGLFLFCFLIFSKNEIFPIENITDIMYDSKEKE